MDNMNFSGDRLPLVSVIIPVYNVEAYLERCVNSIIAQTYGNLEIILVDDGAKDSSGTMCDQFSDPRIVVIHQKNQGLSAARNTGIIHAGGSYLFFVDSDDYVPSDAVSRLVAAALKYQVPYVMGGILEIDESGKTLNDSFLQKDRELDPRDILLKKFPLNEMVQGKLYSRSLFEQLRFPVGKIHEDSNIFHRVLSLCKGAASVSGIAYYYVFHQNSISKAKWSIRRLDAVEALLGRCLFFATWNDPEAKDAALKTFGSAMYCFSTYYASRNWKLDQDHRARNKELQSMANSFRSAIQSKLSFQRKLWIGCYCTDMYHTAKLLSIRKKI